MEAFKLLTRSSTLQKSKSSGKEGASSARAVPPSAQPATPSRSTASAPEAVGRGTKRKRGSPGEQRTQERQAQKKNAREDRASTFPGSKAESPMTVEERRSVLKQNKVKVTVLQATAQKSLAVGAQIYPLPLTSFDQLRSKYAISRRLEENILSQGYKEPTEVQLGSIPLLLAEREERTSHDQHEVNSLSGTTAVDLLTVAPTGSGKTLAFLIPTLQKLIDDRHTSTSDSLKSNGVKAIVLAPSHELVEQIVNEGRKLAHGTGIRVSALKKGMRVGDRDPDDEEQDAKEFEDDSPNDIPHSTLKSEVVVSTPPMLLNAITAGSASSVQALPLVRHLILDEADILLDKMFYDRTMAVWNACVNPALRVSLWSATINSTVESFVQRHILDRRKRLVPKNKPIAHCVLRLVVGLKDSSIPNIDHRLTYAASEQGKLVALRQLMHPTLATDGDNGGLRPPFLVFTQTIPRAVALHSELLYDIPPEAGGSSRIAVLHSELSETARSGIMAAVRKGDVWVLITTDLLSRGIDFKGMNGVVSYDIPSTSASYVHRAGRTGRQGREGGVAITLYTKEDIPYVKNVANVIAASAKAKAAKLSGDVSTGDQDLQRWLLDSLPDVSKKTRQRLKQSGIEHRKTSKAEGDSKHARSMRISTKSGYERKVQNRKRATLERSRQHKERTDRGDNDEQAPPDTWEGFD